MRPSVTVQALASQGGEIALDDTFVFDIACSNHLMMSPSFCGSDPYPCGSLTYRMLYGITFYVYCLYYAKKNDVSTRLTEHPVEFYKEKHRKM